MGESKQRIEAFSDAIYAIIMTIAVLEVPLPKNGKYHEFLLALLTFALSFFVVASFWNNHRHLFQHLEKVNEKMIFFNTCYLFSLSLIPVFTKWTIHRGKDSLPIVFFGGLLLLINFTFARLFITSGALSEIKTEYQRLFNTLYHRREFITYIAILVLMALGYYFPDVALVFFLGIPLLNFTLGTSFERRRYQLRREKQNQLKHFAS